MSDLRDLEGQINTMVIRSIQGQMGEKSERISQPRVLRKLLTKEIIMNLFNEYKRRGAPSWQDIDTDGLCNEVRDNSIIILTMLIYFGMGRTIIAFKNDSLSDEKLPLLTSTTDDEHHYFEKQPDTRPTCFEDGAWRDYMTDMMLRMQWKLDVPYLEMGSNLVPNHIDFRSDVVLPWCKPPDSASQSTTQIEKDPPSEPLQGGGGYSDVERVHIHGDYHGFDGILDMIGLKACANNYFALKTLKAAGNKDLENMYQNEMKQLRNFNGTVSRHLVTLLTTFTHRGTRNFLFPWATCDLVSYWETQQTQPWSLENARWFSKQLVGIAGAVQAIHHPPHLPGQYGRHGDLKPDNILWYKQCEDDPNGILVVSDMGFTVAHRTYSRSKDAAYNTARTPSYYPPEIDNAGGTISSKYDVWTLGCVFLEMVTWFLGGKEELSQFVGNRKLDISAPYGARTATFFTRNLLEESEANIKKSVFNQMENIRKHKYQSQFTDDVIKIIEHGMMLVDPSKRAKMKELQEEFTAIDKKCKVDPNYCTTRSRPDDV
ncbi:putative serine threonine protein kinase [Rosellinia necatrix]|uniref:Putative serine threonine protein kinase n=1 Tax=Rosellinia necatrix TaxID=77044 RepID=A0A1W2TGX9_ROSNE|nr:putative serine threonine protein kinase [Rosellinia necatrix]